MKPASCRLLLARQQLSHFCLLWAVAGSGAACVSGSASGGANADAHTMTGGATSGGAVGSSGGAVGSGGIVSSGGVVGSGGLAGSGGFRSPFGSGGSKGAGGTTGTPRTGGNIGTIPATGGAGPAVGTGGSSGSGAASGMSGTSMIPVAKEACPEIKTGTVVFLGQAVTITAGTPTADQHGPLVIYWFATGSSPREVNTGLGSAAIAEITGQGGLVAAPAGTTKKGTDTGNGVWYTGDFDVADEVVACASAQMHIDTKRIYAAGFSAGGLQTTWMAYARSGYLAAVVPYSGGLTGFGSSVLDPVSAPQDPHHMPSAMVVHGASGSDVVVLDFAQQSAAFEADLKKKNTFSMDCNHGGGHMIPAGIGAWTWRFMKDHTFGVVPDAYQAGIPTGFPTYCQIVP